MPRPRHLGGHEAGLLNRDEIDEGGWSPTMSIRIDPMAYVSQEDCGAAE